jgi:hypothetical protein
MAIWQMHQPRAGATVARKRSGTHSTFPFWIGTRPTSLQAALVFPHIAPGAAFALRPSFASVARDPGRCDHNHPRWGGHTTVNAYLQHPSCSAHRLLS